MSRIFTFLSKRLKSGKRKAKVDGGRGGDSMRKACMAVPVAVVEAMEVRLTQ